MLHETLRGELGVRLRACAVDVEAWRLVEITLELLLIEEVPSPLYREHWVVVHVVAPYFSPEVLANKTAVFVRPSCREVLAAS